MSRGVWRSRAPSRYLRSACANWARIAARALSESCSGRRSISRRTTAGSSGTGPSARQRAGDDLRLGRGPAPLPAAVGPLFLGALDRRAAVIRAPDLLDVAEAGPGRRAGLLGRDRRGGLQQRARGQRRLVVTRQRREQRGGRGGGQRGSGRHADPAAAPARVSAREQPGDLGVGRLPRRERGQQVLDHVSSKVSRRASRPRLSSERTVAGRQPRARAIASSGRSCT